MKKMLALALCLLMALSLAVACKGENAEQEENVKVVVLAAGALGDRSFYDSANEGLEALVKDHGIDGTVIECNNENFLQQMTSAAETADIVVPVGWEFWEIEQLAPEVPETTFIWIDNETSVPYENVLNITYAQNEGSFLVGYLAAKMSETGIIGVVGGEDSVTINDFIVGYEQGAKYADPDITVLTRYSNTYDDVAIGKECALALNDMGADVIFQVAGKCGSGVFEAAAERGFYAIGVDSDQKYLDENVIICSMKKEVGLSIYAAVEAYLEGTLEVGRTWVADLGEGYVGVGYGEDGSVQQISDELKAEINGLIEQILRGEIIVDTTR